jgi:hypothetical protein
MIATETKGETGEAMRSKTLKSLLFHMKIADSYDIPELRHYASTKVQNILNTSLSSRDFVIREVVQTKSCTIFSRG